MRDVNLELASLLYDMAAIAGDTQRALGYKRAAKAVLRIDRDITPLITANTFKADLRHRADHRPRRARADPRRPLARSSNARCAESGKAEEIARLHNLRRQYLSRAAVTEVLSRKGCAVAREVSRRLPDALDLERRRGDARVDHQRLPRTRMVCAGITDHSYGLTHRRRHDAWRGRWSSMRRSTR